MSTSKTLLPLKALNALVVIVRVGMFVRVLTMKWCSEKVMREKALDFGIGSESLYL